MKQPRVTPTNGSVRRSRRAKLRFASILIVVILGAGIPIWRQYFRGTGWLNALNPWVWYRIHTGGDLYNADQAVLNRGNHDLHEVALTFDDGPHGESRGKILDALKSRGDHATFFDVGINIEKRPDLLLRTIQEGHEIANHSFHHLRLDTLDAKDLHREINDTDILYDAITGHHLSALRPPGMRYNDTVVAETKRLGYIVVGYTSASKDFEVEESPALISERTLRRIQNGSILLLHDYPATAAALPTILDSLKSRGFRCVTIQEMIDHLPERARNAAHSVEATSDNAAFSSKQ